jgi:predicted nucleotidyltransferase/HEPN domain-containing protein
MQEGQAMRTDISHLPARNQRELEAIVRAVFEEFEDAHKLASGERKAGRILKIILYGSMARGEGIYEPHTEKGYVSDYDILVIVNQDELTDHEYWYHLENRMVRDYMMLHRLRHPVSLIVHTLQEVNNNLADGRFFFLDVVKDAVALYQSDDSELATPRPKRPTDALALAREYFDEWYPSAGEFYETFEFSESKKRYKQSAFLLHQVTERLYHTLLLTCTLYTPHSHNLENLRNQAKKIDRRLLFVWPDDDKKSRRRFSLLKDAYVKARYSKHYRISGEDLAWLGERVQELSAIVREVCTEKLAELEQAAAEEAGNT